ncbi:hypothetical protein MLD38_002161 [Melastoma candidum]|uniref:Uncharacterized protein n=1 Tax=Melastoma candidum TaxID=119954 RepID=A0ACB9SGU9_9MYRT|nr:hypothetical protein MLD38_002161 [Melastoma candidum]
MEVVRSFRPLSFVPAAAEKFCAASSVGVSALGCKLFRVLLAVFFAIVGITVGAIVGATIGLKSRGGILHGATVGAIIGSVFSTSILGSYVSSWDSESDDMSYAWILPWIDSTAILAAKLVHDYYMRVLDHPRRGSRSEKYVDTTRMNLTRGHLVDPSGNRLSCSICLQELELSPFTQTFCCEVLRGLEKGVFRCYAEPLPCCPGRVLRYFWYDYRGRGWSFHRHKDPKRHSAQSLRWGNLRRCVLHVALQGLHCFVGMQGTVFSLDPLADRLNGNHGHEASPPLGYTNTGAPSNKVAKQGPASQNRLNGRTPGGSLFNLPAGTGGDAGVAEAASVSTHVPCRLRG